MGSNVNKRFIVLALFFSIITFTHNVHGFSSISSLEKYVEKMDEYPVPDNYDFLNPIYKTSMASKSFLLKKYYILNKVAGFFGLKKWVSKYIPDVINPDRFERMINEREESGYTEDFILKINPTPGSKFIIWGNLDGDLHSLTRCLLHLKEMKIIDDNFKILSSNNYFVFNGNYIGAMPYAIETLVVISILITQNHDNVIYIKGENESKDNWKKYAAQISFLKDSDYVLKDPKYISADKIPLGKLAHRFLNSLPSALYLMRDTDVGREGVRISYHNRQYKMLNETGFSEFLKTKNKKEFDLFYLKDRKRGYEEIPIKAIINAEKDFDASDDLHGLRSLKPDMGSTAWAISSCPTRAYRTLFNFHNDAFTILAVGENIRDWNLSLYYRDIRKGKGFSSKTYNLLSGDKLYENVSEDILNLYRNRVSLYEKEKAGLEQKILKLAKQENREKELEEGKDPLIHFKNSIKKPSDAIIKTDDKVVGKVDKNEIIIGCIADLSKGASYLSKGVLQGTLLCLNRENKLGGVRGKSVRLMILDDEYNPQLTGKKAKTLWYDHNIDIFLTSFGSSTTEMLLPQIKSGSILVVFPYAGSENLRYFDLEHIIHYRPSFIDEISVLVKHATEKLGLKRIAVFYQDDIFDKDRIGEALEKFKELGIEDFCDASYAKGSIDVSGAVRKIKTFNPDGIILCSLEQQTRSLVQKLGADYFANRALLGISSSSSVRPFLRKKGLNMVVTTVVPPFDSEYLEMVREYNTEREKEGYEGSYIALEGYISASIFIDILRSVVGEITKESIIKEAKKIKERLFKGLNLNFDNQKHSLSTDIWVDDGKGWAIHERIAKKQTEQENPYTIKYI